MRRASLASGPTRRTRKARPRAITTTSSRSLACGAELWRYEEHFRRLNNPAGFIDLFWPGKLLVEKNNAGRNLTAARAQGAAPVPVDFLDRRQGPNRALNPARTRTATARRATAPRHGPQEPRARLRNPTTESPLWDIPWDTIRP